MFVRRRCASKSFRTLHPLIHLSSLLAAPLGSLNLFGVASAACMISSKTTFSLPAGCGLLLSYLVGGLLNA
jgi:hypothetical protein